MMISNKLFLALTLACAVITLPSPASAAAGQLDSTFAKGGIFLANNAGLTNSVATAFAIGRKGRIVIAGQLPLPPGGSPQPAVFRLNSNGALDTSFGTNGVASINFREGGGEIATSLVLQPDGKIVIGVSLGTADAPPALVLVRLDENGAIDSSFGNSGVAFLFRGGPDIAFLVQQCDGKLLAGGGMLIARVTADGALDTTFGQNGIAPLVAPAASIVLESGGKILAISGPAGVLESTPLMSIGVPPVASTIVRYNQDGTLDTSFATLGRSASIVGISAALLQSNGEIVAVGPITSKSFVVTVPALTFETAFAAARYNSNGGIDDTFGSEGAAITSFGSAPVAVPSGLVIQSDGRIIAAGEVETSVSAGEPPSASLALARYTSTGALDTSFGSGGTVLTSIGPSSSTNAAGIVAVALDAEGRLVAVGNVSESSATGAIPQTSMVVARYLTQ
ncbi:MAG: hypothetical protein JO097_13390 [Acidobacteriaceae bacterium]|nr:hypothetical protein [Acidobacteriaceae bacterium]